MSELAELQKKCVFVPTDKAANNIAIVCKRKNHERIEHLL